MLTTWWKGLKQLGELTIYPIYTCLTHLGRICDTTYRKR